MILMMMAVAVAVIMMLMMMAVAVVVKVAKTTMVPVLLVVMLQQLRIITPDIHIVLETELALPFAQCESCVNLFFAEI